MITMEPRQSQTNQHSNEWLSTEDTCKFPQFAELLTKLSNYVQPDGTSVSLSKEAQQAEGKMKAEKGKWLQYHTLTAELEALLQEKQKHSQDRKFYYTVDQCLIQCQALHYINCSADPFSKVTLFGLSEDDLQRSAPSQDHVHTIQRRIIPELEERLNKKCERLRTFYTACNITEGDNVDDIPKQLAHAQEKVLQERDILKQARAKLENNLQRYHQVLLESLQTLQTTLAKHKKDIQYQDDVITANWLESKCKAFSLKIKLLELEMMCETYSKNAVKALIKIRNHLDVSLAELKHKTDTTQHALKAYQAVGPLFDTLVQEYSQLKSELDDKKWGLEQLQQTQNS